MPFSRRAQVSPYWGFQSRPLWGWLLTMLLTSAKAILYHACGKIKFILFAKSILFFPIHSTNKEVIDEKNV
jgi:hypothetical protein